MLILLTLSLHAFLKLTNHAKHPAFSLPIFILWCLLCKLPVLVSDVNVVMTSWRRFTKAISHAEQYRSVRRAMLGITEVRHNNSTVHETNSALSKGLRESFLWRGSKIRSAVVAVCKSISFFSSQWINILDWSVKEWVKTFMTKCISYIF